MDAAPSPSEHGVSIRPARDADIPAIETLDRAASAHDASAEPAADGEFARGIAEQGLLVAVDNDGPGTIAGFIQFGPTVGAEWFIYGEAVHHERQGQGIGRRLIDAALVEIRKRAVSDLRIAATTAPANAGMIRLLTQTGFVGTAWVDDYFGPGKDRLYFEMSSGAFPDYTELILIPGTSINSIKGLLQGKRHLVDSATLPHGWHVEVAMPLDSEPASVKTNEVSVSSAFAGTLMAAFTFLFGFALTTPQIGADLLGAAGVGVLVSLLALIAYTNASGDLARLKPRAWDRLIRAGNAWSEFGAVYAIFALTPALVLSATGLSAGAAVIAAVASLLLFAYHASEMDISHRYVKRRAMWATVRTIYTALPVAGLAVWWLVGSTWPWTAGLGTLSIIALVAALTEGAETS